MQLVEVEHRWQPHGRGGQAVFGERLRYAFHDEVMIRGQRNMSRGDALDRTKLWAARQRVSPEGQEGLSAFLEKRPPSWRE